MTSIEVFGGTKLAGVEDQIDQHLAQSTAVGHDVGQDVGQSHAQALAALVEQRPHDRLDVVHDRSAC